jgi:hypothetical protein
MSAEKSRIMYIEDKTEGLSGPANIGRVTFSKTGKTLRYKNKRFQSLKGSGFKANYFDVETGAQYWISGPRKDGCDRLHGGSSPVEVDEDVAEEYWTTIRQMPAPKHTNRTQTSTQALIDQSTTREDIRRSVPPPGRASLKIRKVLAQSEKESGNT